MRRKRNAGAPPFVAPQPQPQIVTQERTYSLITPLFGGGAVTGERDEVTIIRGTEIRGHLRFWWRACYGGRYSSVDEMKKDEDRIWGAAATSKKGVKDSAGAELPLAGAVKSSKETTVQISVEPINDKNIIEQPAFQTNNKGKPVSASGIPGYAAFPLQRTDKKPSGLIYKNVRFLLTISFPRIRQNEIEGTLWAWETFGGIGARTRRGFGAIKLDKAERIDQEGKDKKRSTIEYELPEASVKEVKTWLKKRFAGFYIQKKAPGRVPSLSQAMLEEHIHISLFREPDVHKGENVQELREENKDEEKELAELISNATEVWNILITKLRKFRQPGKDPNNKWPDTREIKKLKNAEGASSEQKYELLKAPLGLPIVFHFPDEDKDADLTLQGSEEGRERLSSPLILRPLACRDRKAVGLAVLLENYDPHPDKLQVMKKVDDKLQKIPAVIETGLDIADIGSIAMLSGEEDVLKAFMNYLRPRARGSNQNNNKQRGSKR